MTRNPIEANPVTRFALGLAVIVTMSVAAYLVGNFFVALGVPYPGWIGTAVGTVVVFAAFVVLYRRYDATAPRHPDERSN
ncbi:hypothetical protein [Halopiger djelfimassiliensis]|uniref:hypothetical protein n=1 Tax=Halopiger djelfimassiliensis TaxID=1293047 RepID=UPI00067761C3|nr:hypothetical protein [Halopiger djelfimassiliensis]